MKKRDKDKDSKEVAKKVAAAADDKNGTKKIKIQFELVFKSISQLTSKLNDHQIFVRWKGTRNKKTPYKAETRVVHVQNGTATWASGESEGDRFTLQESMKFDERTNKCEPKPLELVIKEVPPSNVQHMCFLIINLLCYIASVVFCISPS